MLPIWCNGAALAVALLFYAWRAYARLRLRKDRALRARVAYMLWVMAQQAGGAGPAPAG
jgi:hypothetical protein